MEARQGSDGGRTLAGDRPDGGPGAAVLRALPWAALGLALAASVAIMVRGGWTPLGDDAMIASYVLDVPGQLPLKGMPTSLALRTGTPVHHPGPLPFWLMAPTTHALGAPGTGLGLGALLIHVGSLAVTAVFALRMRPRWAAWVVVGCLAVLLTNTLHGGRAIQPFNANLTVVSGFGAALGLWAFLAGDDWALPGLAFLGSLAAQAHVTLLPLVGVLVLVAVAGTVVEVRRRPREGARRRRLVARVVPVALAVGALSWSGPLADQVAGDGNLLRLVEGGRDVDAVGWSAAVDRLVTAVGIPPGWTEDQVAGTLPPASTGERLGGAAVLGAVALLAVWGLRSRRRPLVAGGVTALAVVASGTFVAARIPADARAQSSPLTRRFWWPVGALVWSVLLVGLLALAAAVVARLRSDRPRPRPAAVVTALAAAASLAVVTASATYLVRSTEPAHAADAVGYGAVRHHARAIEGELTRRSVVRLVAGDLSTENLYFLNGLLAQLRLRGHTVQIEVPDWWGQYLHYQLRHPADEPPDLVVFVRGAERAPEPPPGAELLSTYDPASPPPAFEGYDGPMLLTGGRGRSWLFLLEPEPASDPAPAAP